MKMKGYLDKPAGCLYLAVTNLSELNALLQQAEKEANQLAVTIDRIRRFDFKISISEENPKKE